MERRASPSPSTVSASPYRYLSVRTSHTIRPLCRTFWVTPIRRTPGWRCTSSTPWWKCSAPWTSSSSSAPCTRRFARCWSKPSRRVAPCASARDRAARPSWTSSASSGPSDCAARISRCTERGRSAWVRTPRTREARPQTQRHTSPN